MIFLKPNEPPLLHNDGRKSAFTKADIICTIVCTHVTRVRSTEWIAQSYIQTLKRTGNYTHIYAIFLITPINRCDRIWFIIKPLCQELLTAFGSLQDKERFGTESWRLISVKIL